MPGYFSCTERQTVNPSYFNKINLGPESQRSCIFTFTGPNLYLRRHRVIILFVAYAKTLSPINPQMRPLFKGIYTTKG